MTGRAISIQDRKANSNLKMLEGKWIEQRDAGVTGVVQTCTSERLAGVVGVEVA